MVEVYLDAYYDPLVTSAGLNLQRFCRDGQIFSVALTRAISEHAIGRANCVGQSQIVQLFDTVCLTLSEFR